MWNSHFDSIITYNMTLKIQKILEIINYVNNISINYYMIL
jgi:hypothetical protein